SRREGRAGSGERPEVDGRHAEADNPHGSSPPRSRVVRGDSTHPAPRDATRFPTPVPDAVEPRGASGPYHLPTDTRKGNDATEHVSPTLGRGSSPHGQAAVTALVEARTARPRDGRVRPLPAVPPAVAGFRGAPDRGRPAVGGGCRAGDHDPRLAQCRTARSRGGLADALAGDRRTTYRDR